MRDSFENYRQNYPDGDGVQHTWGGRLDALARAAPDALAFVRGDRELTWKDFERETNRLANGLLSLGMKKEDRVAIMGFNSIEWMTAYFGVSRIGAVPVNVNPRFVPTELSYILENSDARALIVEAVHMEEVKKVLPELKKLEHVIVFNGKAEGGALQWDELMKSPDTRPEMGWRVTNSDFAFLFYTGGTTGYPKGTVWDYYNRVRGLDAIMITAMKPLIRNIQNLPDEVYPALLSTLPGPLTPGVIKSRPVGKLLSYSDTPRFERLVLRILGSKMNYKLAAGKMKLLTVAPLFHGTAYEADFSMIAASAGTTIFLEHTHPFDPAELWETVQKRRANILVIVGDAFAVPMIEELERKNYDVSSLAVIISSGVRFSPSVKKRFIKKHPGLLILDELGSTETSAAYTQVSSANDADISLLKIKVENKGINCTRVINPETGEDARPGQPGELVFGGFNSLGYWKDPERTARHYRVIDGRRWFYVGDWGAVDEEGYFHLVGRGSSIINTGGEKVYAEEVEEVLLTHPGIRDAAVTGVPDERWGEAVTALVKTEQGADLTPEEIIEFCRDKMAGYKKPKAVYFVESLPRTVTGKLERGKLKELAGA